LYYIPTLKTPIVGENMLPLKGDLFPEEFPFIDNSPSGNLINLN